MFGKIPLVLIVKMAFNTCVRRQIMVFSALQELKQAKCRLIPLYIFSLDIKIYRLCLLIFEILHIQVYCFLYLVSLYYVCMFVCFSRLLDGSS